MNAERYKRMTETVRAVTDRLPGGTRWLKLPTYLCAAVYLASLSMLLLRGDPRFLRAAVVPAVCFGVVTVLRPIIGRQRPYDAFGIPPVGKYKPGKGKSMPSRHTASAAAIAFAVIYCWPVFWVAAAMVLLGLVIGLLRIISGQHYPSDAAAALLLAAVISWAGYCLI